MKKSIFAKVIGFSLGVSLILGLAACGASGESKETTDSGSTDTASSSTDGQKIEIEFWGWWSSDARKPHIEYMVDSFNQSQDNISVKYVDIPWGDIFTKNMAQIAAGKPADVMAGNFGDVSYGASQSQLTALDDYMNGLSLDQFFDSYAKGSVGEDGKAYAVPLVADTRFIYYNKELFSEIGISEEAGNLPKTWDELQEVAYQLDKTNPDGSLDVMGFHPVLGNGGADTWVVNANKGKLWYDYDTDKMIINTELNKKALEYIMSYTDRYTMRTVDEYNAAFLSGMADPFCSGKLAMLIQTNGYRSAIKQNAPDMEYGVMLIPEMTEGNGNWANGSGFTLEVPFGAKNPEASVEFIKAMTSPEIQAYWAINMGEVPTLKEMDESELSNDVVYTKSMEALQQTNIGEFPNKIAGFRDILNPELDLVFVGQKSIEDALRDAEKTIKATYNID